jgi:Rrf2 family protein
MTLFTSKVDYALRALLDLAQQPPGRAVQSREVALRQGIPEAYLNQLLVVLRRAELVRSIRGASGGYVIGRPLREMTVADVVRAFHGAELLGSPEGREGGHSCGSPAWIVRELRRRTEDAVRTVLEGTTLADLQDELRRADEAQSLMLGI